MADRMRRATVERASSIALSRRSAHAVACVVAACIAFTAGLLAGRALLVDERSSAPQLGVAPFADQSTTPRPPGPVTTAGTPFTEPGSEIIGRSFQPAVPKVDALSLLDTLDIAFPPAERPAYDRDLFGPWLDTDSDCRDTRAEVLAAESTTLVLENCTITDGTWRSPYEGGVHTTTARVQIDHLVSLANAWESGAWTWEPARLAAYMNDLVHPEHLVAVSASINSSKSDQSPDQWMIPTTDQAARCAYLTNWTAIKARWSLTITPAEADTLRRGLSSQC